MSLKKTTEEFVAEARKVHGDRYDYSKVEYHTVKVKVCIVCPEHGEFWQTPEKHLQEHDRRKAVYCASHDLQLVRIRISDLDNFLG